MGVLVRYVEKGRSVRLIRKRCGRVAWETQLSMPEIMALEKRLRRLVRRYHAREQRRHA